MDKMREEFEVWVSSKNLETSFGNYLDDEYDATWTQVYWEGWKESRKALVVELPVAFPVCDDKDSAEVYFADDTRKALDAAGVSHK